jgi:chromosome segregation ATPase
VKNLRAEVARDQQSTIYWIEEFVNLEDKFHGYRMQSTATIAGLETRLAQVGDANKVLGKQLPERNEDLTKAEVEVTELKKDLGGGKKELEGAKKEVVQLKGKIIEIWKEMRKAKEGGEG